MSNRKIHSAIGLVLLGLMILVPTDLLRLGLNTLTGGDIGITMEIEMESDLDAEDKEESKEKHKEKNKITVKNMKLVFGLNEIDAVGSHTDKKSLGNPLAHHLEVSTPPPELI